MDFTANFALGLSFRGARWLCDRLAEEPDGVHEVVVTYRDRWLVEEWQLEGAELRGPGGFALTFTPRVLGMYHLVPFFKAFAIDEPRRTQLRRACRTIAKLVGSPRAIYMHELLPHEGDDLDAIEASLRAQFGPPSATFTELAAAADYGPGCWYIDDFADLR